MVKLSQYYFNKNLLMFNYIKFWMFLMSYQEAPDVTWGSFENKAEIKSSGDPKIDSLRRKFEDLKAWTSYIWDREESLRSWLLVKWDPKDREFRDLAKEVMRLQTEHAWSKAKQDLTWLLLEITTEIKKISPEEVKALKTTTNKEFLSVPLDKRLQYLTKAHTDTAEVSSWQVKELEFNFTFDGEFNKELYLKTTAWQLLPKEVWSVTYGDIVYSRNWLWGEFFDKSGNRLIIHDWTKIQVWPLRTADEIEKIITENLNKAESFATSNPWSDKELALEAYNKWIDPKFANLLFKDKLAWLTWDAKKIEIEILLTQFSRVMDYYIDDYHENAKNGWYATKEFLAYFLNFEWYSDSDKSKIFDELWFDKSILENFKRKEIKAFSWESLSDEEKRAILDRIKNVPEEFTRESFGTQYVPGSAKAKELFMYAANVAELPVEWAESRAFHELLKKESAWRVWVMNYEFKKSAAWEIWNFKDYVVNNNWSSSWEISRKLWTVSNATWLWQMLISNVDIYYPEWRNGIWKPLNEAVWMLRYVKDRYWTPENALDFHIRNNWY